MQVIDLKIAELRKARRLTQQEVADAVGVAFQSVSKWENHVAMPDITVLPLLAEYFDVTVDELLGLSPLKESYRPVLSGTKEYWNKRLPYLERTRKEYWNQDYIQFLIEKVWKINKPVDVLDCGCGYGAAGLLLLPLLPEGSTYTGMDIAEELINKGKELFETEGYDQVSLIEADVLKKPVCRQYDLVISNAVLRHLDDPRAFMEKMVQFAKKDGLVVCMDVNREFECDGFYVDGMDYAKLCAHPGFHDMWKKEKEEQGRDYSVAMKLPHLMRKMGLRHVDARMNDRISFVAPEQEEYDRRRDDFLNAQGWDQEKSEEEQEETVSALVSRGMKRKDARQYCQNMNEITAFAQRKKQELAYTHIRGVIIAYGWK